MVRVDYVGNSFSVWGQVVPSISGRARDERAMYTEDAAKRGPS